MKVKSVVGVCVLLMGCAVPVKTDKSEPDVGQVVAAAPQLQKGESWVYRRGNQATFTSRSLVFPKQLEFPLWLGKVWTFEQWLGSFWMTVDMRAEVFNFKPVTVAAGTFDAYEIRYHYSSRGPFRQPNCGSWTRWYAPQVGNLIASRTYSTATTWELINFKRIPAQ